MNGSESKATSSNPKDLVGAKKVSLSAIPAIAQAYEAAALMTGAVKYGPYNWRAVAVSARIYIDACKRHLDAWTEGQEIDEESLIHHLGHAKACLSILIDAQAEECLIDDRPKGKAYPKGLKYLNYVIKAKAARRKNDR